MEQVETDSAASSAPDDESPQSDTIRGTPMGEPHYETGRLCQLV